MDTKDLQAKAAHDIWAHWMKYFFTQCKQNPDGTMTIASDKVARWTRQARTPFEDLPESERKSDYEIAEKFINPLFNTEEEDPWPIEPGGPEEKYMERVIELLHMSDCPYVPTWGEISADFIAMSPEECAKGFLVNYRDEALADSIGSDQEEHY